MFFTIKTNVRTGHLPNNCKTYDLFSICHTRGMAWAGHYGIQYRVLSINKY